MKSVSLTQLSNKKMRGFIEKIGEYALLMKRVLRKPDRWSIFFKALVSDAYALVISSILLIAIVSAVLGAALVLQVAYNLDSPLLSKMYVGYLARESFILELGSTVLCLVLAGKIGSSIVAEIGAMRITEQIDAMDVMGINSANYIILPKVVAMSIMAPFIMMFSIATGLLGGYLVVKVTNVIMVDEFIEGIRYRFIPYYVVYSIVKTTVYCFIISSVCSFYGYTVKGGSKGVGRASTVAIVQSSVLILVSGLVITGLMLN